MDIRIQTEGIGTVRSGAPDFQDDGPSSDDDDEDDEDLLAPDGLTPTTSTTDLPGKTKTPTPPQKSGGGLAKFFPGKRRQSSRSNSFDSGLATDSSASTPSKTVATQDVKEKKRRPGRSRKARGGEYSFNPENDVLGIVMLEIKGAGDLPKLSNSAYTPDRNFLR